MGKKRKSDRPKKRKRRSQADKADKYKLYLASVQEPEVEVKFFDRAYKSFNDKKKPRVLREDFCGTFAICCEWAKKKDRIAIGVDLDPEPLDWGRKHNLAKLSKKAQERVTLLQEDVRTVSETKADVLAAQNFSFWIFKARDELRRYFEIARENLAPGGILVTDMMGGSECLEEDHEDEREYDGFNYIWLQERFDPITHDARFSISFEFPDGSKMKKAFRYDWRFWTIPEVREVLLEAGFSQVHVYWEGTEKNSDEGNGVFKKRRSAEADPAWIAYVVAQR